MFDVRFTFRYNNFNYCVIELYDFIDTIITCQSFHFIGMQAIKNVISLS